MSHKLLFIDDEVRRIETFIELLTSYGNINVTLAKSAEEGIQLISTTKYDTIITDMTLPIDDWLTSVTQVEGHQAGYYILDFCRNSGVMNDTQVFVLSAMSNLKQLLRTEFPEVRAFEKPIAVMELAEAILGKKLPPLF